MSSCGLAVGSAALSEIVFLPVNIMGVVLLFSGVFQFLSSLLLCLCLSYCSHHSFGFFPFQTINYFLIQFFLGWFLHLEFISFFSALVFGNVLASVVTLPANKFQAKHNTPAVAILLLA